MPRHKTGELRDARHDAGIVFPPTGPPIVVAVLTDATEPPTSSRTVAG